MDTKQENANNDDNAKKPVAQEVDDKLIVDPGVLSARNQCEVLRQLIVDKEHLQNARRIKETAVSMQETFLNERRRQFLRRLETACKLPHQKIDGEEFRGYKFLTQFRKTFENKATDQERVAFIREFLNAIFDGEKPSVDLHAERFFQSVCVAFAKSPYAEEIYLAEGRSRRDRELKNAQKWIKWTEAQFARLKSQNRQREAIKLSNGEKSVLAKFYQLEKARSRLDKFKATFEKATQKHQELENEFKKIEREWTRAVRKTPASDPPEITPDELAQAKKLLRKHDRVWKKKPRTDEQRRKDREYKRASLARMKSRTYQISRSNQQLGTMFKAFSKTLNETENEKRRNARSGKKHTS